MTTSLIGMTALQQYFRMSSGLDLSTPIDNLNVKNQYDFSSDGTGKDQVNRIFHDTRVVSGGLHDDLGLVGSLTDAFGNAVIFARVKSMTLKSISTNTNGIIGCNSVAARFLGPLSASVVVRQNGVYHFTAPDSQAWAITSGTNSTLRISNDNTVSGSNVSYSIVLTGCSS